MIGPSRRSVLLGAAALAALPAAAATRRPVLLRRADTVVTMEGPPVPGADVLIRAGAIAAVGRGLPADDAEVIDCAGHLLMPGIVDTHWHMWNTAARGLWRSARGGFAPTAAALSPHFSPADVGIGVELALAEAVNAGITTVHNWAHNVRSRAHAEAEVAAMTASGVRGRFAYGYPQDAPPEQAMDLDDLAARARRPPSPLVSLGICARGPDRSAAAVWHREWATARRLGLPITTHLASDRAAAAKGGIASLAAAGGLGPDVLLVHLTGANRKDLDRVAREGSPVSISPWTELEVGYGVPPMADLVAAGVTLGLSVDNTVLAGAADPFAVMKLAADLARGTARDQMVVADEAALRWATIDAARAMGLDRQVGSIVPGKRADIVGMRLDGLNLAPAADPFSLVTHAARPDNVSLVLIDGVPHKMAGQLMRVDVPALQQRAQRSIASIRARAVLD
jgi:5-methylthioadenosine/S-adenosylhomocysteine deaminase